MGTVSEMKIDPNEPAFPSLVTVEQYDDARGEHVEVMAPAGGVTKREYLAAVADVSWKAVIELLHLEGIDRPTLAQKLAARARVKVMEADALIAALSKDPEPQTDSLQLRDPAPTTDLLTSNSTEA